jgi:hypothetical protein
MRPLPVLSAVAATALLAVAASPAGAAAGAATTPAAGSSTSSVVLAKVVAAGTDAVVGTVQLVTDTTGTSPVARVVVTPLRAGGTTLGAREVGPADGPQDVGVQSLTVAGIGAVRSPALQVGAATPAAGPTASAGASSLGGLSVLGLPVTVDGTVSAVSSVLGSGATSGKILEVRGLRLPGIGGLLEALGLDLDALGALAPGVLAQLVERLGLPAGSTQLLAQVQALADAQTAVDTARAGVATAQAGVTTASGALTAAQAALAPAEDELATRVAARTTARSAYDAALAAVQTAGLACALLPGDALCTTLASATTTLDAAQAAVTAQEAVVAPLRTAVTTAQAALDAAGAALAQAVALLDRLLADLAALLASLPGLVAQLTAALDATPLLSLDALSVVTRATASSAAPGGQEATVAGGRLEGLRVLGTDVLALPQVRTALGLASGATGVDVATLTGDRLAALQAAVGGVLGTLTDLLDGAVPGLVVPAITVKVLERTTTTGVDGAFGTATAGIGGLRIALPALTVPTSLLPTTLTAAAVQASAVTQPVELVLGTLTETVRFRPAATTAAPVGGPGGTPGTTPGTTTPITSGSPLPRTGPQVLVALTGLALLGGAALVRRRLTGEEPAQD